MSDTKPGGATHLSDTPKVDALKALLDIFSVEQLLEIADVSKNLALITDRRPGDLVIGFTSGHPRYINGYLRRPISYTPAKK